MVGTRLGDAISEKPRTDGGIHCCFALCGKHEGKKTVNMLSKNMGEITLLTRGGSILYPSVNTGN